MFGYVRPLKGELKCREFDHFKSVYCGLCHTLAKRYGLPSRFVLSYDLTFLATVFSALDGGTTFEHKRCPANPLAKKCVACTSNSLELAADLTVILAYRKLDDSVKDSTPLKSFGFRVLRLILNPAFRKAKRFRPQFTEKTDNLLRELEKLEEENCPSLDQTADSFARILSEACYESAFDPKTVRVLSSMFYHIGRWIYIIDACADYTEDMQRGEYNPIVHRFKSTEPVLSETMKKELGNTLSHSLATASSAFELLDLGPHEGLVANVLYLGLAAVTSEVLAGNWDKRRKSDDRPL